MQMITYYLLMARYRAETNAEVAELADALDSKSSVVTLRAGSSPAFGTIELKALGKILRAFIVRSNEQTRIKFSFYDLH